MQGVLEKMGPGCKAIHSDGRPAAFEELYGVKRNPATAVKALCIFMSYHIMSYYIILLSIQSTVHPAVHPPDMFIALILLSKRDSVRTK